MAADASRGTPLVLSTRNPHKLEEVRRILQPLRIVVDPLPDGIELPPEDGNTFAENALPKARAAAAATGRPAIADDSGIEAQALGGAPGVHSARYAGPQATDQENLQKLIREVPAESGLRYRCALAYVDPAGAEHLFFGDCDGRMATRPRGTKGFGYDPVFIPDDELSGRTMAELTEAEKDQISHRGRALRAFAQWLGA
jgi:XTP/dITP diphosphohydrolase